MWITFVDGKTLDTAERCLWCNICMCLMIRKKTRNQGMQISTDLVNQGSNLFHLSIVQGVQKEQRQRKAKSEREQKASWAGGLSHVCNSVAKKGKLRTACS